MNALIYKSELFSGKVEYVNVKEPSGKINMFAHGGLTVFLVLFFYWTGLCCFNKKMYSLVIFSFPAGKPDLIWGKKKKPFKI